MPRFLFQIFCGLTLLSASAFPTGVNAQANLSAEQMYAKGENYHFGRNGEIQNYEKAAHWYKLAAEKDYGPAQFYYGLLYYQGRGVVQNFNIAFRWFQAATKSGNIQAYYYLGFMLFYGKGIEQQYPKAFEWFLKAAEKGHDASQYYLGFMYYYGRGVTQNSELAFTWFEKSALQNYAPAEYYLGLIYEQGKFVPRDDQKAFDWYRRAVQHGDLNAKRRISNLDKVIENPTTNESNNAVTEGASTKETTGVVNNTSPNTVSTSLTAVTLPLKESTDIASKPNLAIEILTLQKKTPPVAEDVPPADKTLTSFLSQFQSPAQQNKIVDLPQPLAEKILDQASENALIQENETATLEKVLKKPRSMPRLTSLCTKEENLSHRTASPPVTLAKGDCAQPQPSQSFTHCEYKGANLRKANFENADLSGVNLVESNLEGANFRGARLAGTDFTNANLSEADISFAYLHQAQMRGTNMEKILACQAMMEHVSANGAFLFQADLFGAQMKSIQLNSAFLVEAILSNADLTKAYFIQSYLRNTQMEKTNLSKANFNGALGVPHWIVHRLSREGTYFNLIK